jgi:ABC-type Fe3+-hydroxamate transport system substrate-binding protein
VTRFCTHPPNVVGVLPKVGGTKNPDIDAIVSLRPDLVVVNSEENRQEDFTRLEQAGLAIFVSFPRTVEEAALSIERLGAALDRETAAGDLSDSIRAAAQRVATAAGRRIFCPIWRNPWMSFNDDTFAHDILRRAGGLNVCADLEARYPKVELEAVAAADPEVILLPDEPYVFAEEHKSKLVGLERSTAVRNGEVHLIDGKALSWYGPRTPAALEEFARLLAG